MNRDTNLELFITTTSHRFHTGLPDIGHLDLLPRDVVPAIQVSVQLSAVHQVLSLATASARERSSKQINARHTQGHRSSLSAARGSGKAAIARLGVLIPQLTFLQRLAGRIVAIVAAAVLEGGLVADGVGDAVGADLALDFGGFAGGERGAVVGIDVAVLVFIEVGVVVEVLLQLAAERHGDGVGVENLGREVIKSVFKNCGESFGVGKSVILVSASI